MKSKVVMVVWVVLILVGIWGYHESVAQQARDSQDVELRIAVVDVAKVLTLCKSNTDREAAGKKKNEAMHAELQNLRKELVEIQEELENVLKPGTPEHEKKLLEWFQKRSWEKDYVKAQEEILSRDSLVWLEALYGMMLGEIRLLAMQQGITLILDKDEVDERPSNISKMYTMISLRKVLYNAPSLDITDEVIERLDTAYEKEKNR